MPKTERLYYFTCTKYALEGIQKRRLKATQLDKTNDPFELLACRSESVEGMETEEYFRWRHSLDWRMLCLSKTYKNPLMWGHYADKGKGICLGFDVIIDDGSPVPRAFEVDYQPARVRPDYEPPGLASIPSSLKFWLNTRLVKSRDWAYEKEWRMWVHTHDDLTFDTDKDMYFIPFKNRLTLEPLAKLR